ncbi:hypothetical protein GGTG_11962 [Gaeumannomyces tritici R3-111a-1]|uniref:Uncharacterized protein n=1 Tax=Gaeumannomyces tritici (strain R3-111a-1) TaxID=644352 RepID=J3PEN1_GAET3|nr:hypothetical protein GGTG_11962 [Gaeumannomyces tritici R3-111a-1]EJT70939.1 hypothetical protein GGTG_11962 [Gaeumannomyces tritici R3-111a-1]
MKAVAVAIATLCASMASAWVVITPVTPEMVVPKQGNDCFWGVTTPQGCAPFVRAPKK